MDLDGPTRCCSCTSYGCRQLLRAPLVPSHARPAVRGRCSRTPAVAGGGVIGGGFGAQGAVEGMLIAGALNALTSSTKVDSVLRIGLPAAEIALAFEDALPATVDLALAPLWVFSVRVRPLRRSSHRC